MITPRTGVRVFDSERTQPDRPGTLLEAYDLVVPPKPSLTVVVDLVKKGEITADTTRPIMKVESVDFFREELEEWMAKTNWLPSRGGFAIASLPPGFVLITQFLRDHVSLADGRRIGLYSKSDKTARMSAEATVWLFAGDVPSAIKVTGRGYWAARQSDIEEWVWRRWQCEIKR